MKKYFKYIISAICLSTMAYFSAGCSLIKDGSTISWSKVDSVCTAVQLASQIAVYAVCVKNTDFAPIFKAIGEGLIVISGTSTSTASTPEQISTYISGLLDSNKWGSLATQVNNVLATVIAKYTTFYAANKDNLVDGVNVCTKVIAAIGNGLVAGSNIDTASASMVGASLDSQSAQTQVQIILDNIDVDVTE